MLFLKKGVGNVGIIAQPRHKWTRLTIREARKSPMNQAKNQFCVTSVISYFLHVPKSVFQSKLTNCKLSAEIAEHITVGDWLEMRLNQFKHQNFCLKFDFPLIEV